MHDIFELLNFLWEILTSVFQGYCLCRFYAGFLEYKRPDKITGRISIILIYVVTKVGISELLPADYGSIRIILRLALTFILLVILAACFYKAAKRITLFLIITFMAVNEISFFISYMILIMSGGLIDIYIWCMNNKIFILPDIFEKISWGTIILSQLLMRIIFGLLIYFSLREIMQDFREKDYDIQKTELLFLLAPGMTALLICVLLRIIIVTVENGVPKLLYDKYPILDILVPLILILSLLSVLYVVKLFQDMIYFNREKSNRIVLEKQVISLQEHIGEMERIHSDIRGMKHDMKNTLSVIMRLANGENEVENKELQEYLLELNKSMDKLDFRFNTGNSVVDILLNMKYHEIIRDIPDFKMDAERLIFPKELLINSYDMGIILGNALDNAITACRKLKEASGMAETFIRIYSFGRGNMFFIDIENSFDGKLIRKRNSEFPATDKADASMHGIGIVNIKNAVEKYHGAVDWSVNNKIFTLLIMMKNERREEDGF